MNSLKVFIEGMLELNFAEGLLDDQDLFQFMKSGISALESEKERDDVCNADQLSADRHFYFRTA